ncbi:hypothetical protein OQY15_16880 [Pedobacter sp. MC2016-15]|uniref:hypothetical protein n=1 Tax=Pedobacter sp. MC2016-15 TaxID=2994473 RepID=UPI0022477EFC|nr:hypothetical protein [Pedobacter sp. MC2016-15]MCX2480782.1 hypothetical protein [Pedobacter sp. MC2016-15]
MSKPIIENLKTWPHNLSTRLRGGLSKGLKGGMYTGLYGGLSSGLYGGLSTALYGGLSTGIYGRLSKGLGGGMSTSSSNVYHSNIPPWPVFLRELDLRGYKAQAELIRKHLPEQFWPENFF